MKNKKENWLSGFNTRFKWSLTCGSICALFEVGKNQLAAFKKNRLLNGVQVNCLKHV